MISSLLLARNFVRQNRWLLLAFVLWPFLMGAFLWSPSRGPSLSDLSEIMQEEVFYGIVVMAFLTSSAIYNERRSRRIVGVLSKGVSRAEYLFGLLLGAACFAGSYFLAIAASLIWLLEYSNSLLIAVSILMARGLTASVWIGALALLFSTFLFPFVATALAGALAFAMIASSRAPVLLDPLPTLLAGARDLGTPIVWSAVPTALVQSIVFIALAAHIFAHRDIAVSVE